MCLERERERGYTCVLVFVCVCVCEIPTVDKVWEDLIENFTSEREGQRMGTGVEIQTAGETEEVSSVASQSRPCDNPFGSYSSEDKVNKTRLYPEQHPPPTYGACD